MSAFARMSLRERRVHEHEQRWRPVLVCCAACRTVTTVGDIERHQAERCEGAPRSQ